MILFVTILFVLAILVLASLFLVKLAQLSAKPQVSVRIATQGVQHESVWPYFKHKLGILLHRFWHFVLEAKDLKPPVVATTKAITSQVAKVKNVFRVRIRASEDEPAWLPEAAELVIKPNIKSPEELYLEAIKKDPADKQAYEALGRLYLQNKNYADAIETYEYLTKLDPTVDIYWSNLGLAFYSIKEFSKAADSYEKAIGINGKIPTRWVNLALCFEALEEHTKTVKALNQALQLDQMNVNYQMLLADAYLNISNNVRAEEVLEQILAHDPTNRQAREKLMRLKI